MITFNSLLIIGGVAIAVPLRLGLAPAVKVPFIVVATIIGVETNHQRSSTATALVVAGLLSVVIYPPIALQLLNRAANSQASRPPALTPAPAEPARREESP